MLTWEALVRRLGDKFRRSCVYTLGVQDVLEVNEDLLYDVRLVVKLLFICLDV